MDEPPLLPWDGRGWVTRVESWVESELGSLDIRTQGTFELVRTRPWAAVGRIATSTGDVWFKEPAPAFAFEPAVTAAVAARCPDFAPEVLAAEGSWLLTRDAGPQLRTLLRRGEPTPAWDDLIARYAELQIELADQVEPLVILGAPDKRPGMVSRSYLGLIDRVEALGSVDVQRLRALAPQLESLVEELGQALPATLIHEEFHETNVFVREGSARLLDWAEVAVSHPFAGLVNTLRDIAYRRRLKPNGREMLRLRSAYLEPWTALAPHADLQRLFDRGYVLGALCRALTWDRLLDGHSAAARAEYGRNAAVWLDLIFRDALENGVRLGA